jgi:hypothetical protein
MTDLEKLAIKLANTFLNAHIGVTWHLVRKDEKQIDIPQVEFEELRELALAILGSKNDLHT